MSNQEFEGKGPADEPPAGTPESLEQQLAKERDARVSMRDRLRHTEALAAESHALRARMAQELERVTADRDRLRSAAATAPAAGAAGTASAAATKPPAGTGPQFTPRMAPPTTPRADDWSLRPPAPPARSGPWRALAMLGGLAAGVAGLAWITGTLPGESGTGVAATSASAPTPPRAASKSVPALAATRPSPSASALKLATASPAPAATLPMPGGAVALPPLAPERQLAAAPSAAGPAPATATAPAPATTPTGLSARLRTALDGEGIAAQVEVDASTGHVMVADPQSDHASRERIDLVIRAVYAGANQPEPQIEHRWLSPRRSERPLPTATATAPTRAPKPVETSNLSVAAAYAARHAAAEHATEHRQKTAGSTVAEAEELRPVLPEGRVTAGCRASFAGKTPHRADMTACMKRSCCTSSANHQAEDCRAYEKAYPFTCGPG